MKKLLVLIFMMASVVSAITMPDYVNIKNTPSTTLERYGAVADGTTDCSPAFAAALASGVSIHLGSGTYYCATPVKLVDNIQIIGAGPRMSQIKGAAGSPVFYVPANTVGFNTFKDIRIRGGSVGVYNGSGSILYSTLFDNVEFYDLSVAGVRAENTSSWLQVVTFTNCNFIGTTSGIALTAGDSNLVHIDKCRFEQLASTCIHLSSAAPGFSLTANQLTIRGCRFEAGAGKGIVVDNGFTNLGLYDNYFENVGTPNVTILNTGASGKNMTYLGNFHSGNMQATDTISLVLGEGLSASTIATNYVATVTIDCDSSSVLTYFGNSIHGTNGSADGGVSFSGAGSTNPQIFAYNDLGAPLNQNFELGNDKVLQMVNGAIQFFNATGYSVVDTNASNSIRLYPSTASSAGILIDSSGYVEAKGAGFGITLISANGTRYQLYVTDAGVATTTPRP